jgi:hypothetical protein
MKILKIIFVLFVLSMGYTSYGQEDCNYKQIITIVDSISKVQHIEIGKVKILFISNTFDKTDTDQRSLTKAKKFHFERQFLVIDDKYFNLNKLLYFYIKDGVFEFFFQGY